MIVLDKQEKESVHVLSKELSRIRGVVAVILFGSYARGEDDEGSDLDLLVLFDSDKLTSTILRAVSRTTGHSPLFVQAIPITLKEFEDSWLSKSIVREGRVLYSRKGFDIWRLGQGKLRPFSLLSYEYEGLKHKDKVRFLHGLVGRRVGDYDYPGLIDEIGGFRVGRNTVMIPAEDVEEVARYLTGYKVEWTQRRVWST